MNVKGHSPIYRVVRLPDWMVGFDTFGRRENLFHDTARPRWQKCSVYLFGTLAVGLISFFLLRDTTPIQFVPSQMSDMDRPRGEMASKEQLEDVYWRVSIRHASTTLEEICKTEDYTVLTHKNIVMDGKPMEQSYIYLCQPIGDIRSVLNVRAVIPPKNGETVTCIETYGNKTKQVTRNYPFSLKYISSETFDARTRVVRDAAEACTWLHAIDIVESIWD